MNSSQIPQETAFKLEFPASSLDWHKIENSIISISNMARDPGRIQAAVIDHNFVGQPYLAPLDYALIPPNADS